MGPYNLQRHQNERYKSSVEKKKIVKNSQKKSHKKKVEHNLHLILSNYLTKLNVEMDMLSTKPIKSVIFFQ